MKKISFLSLVFALCVLAYFSCTKTYDNPNQNLSKKQILIRQPWKVDEVMSNVSGKNVHYIRGGINNTGVDYSKFKLVFNNDGTGTYTAESGITFNTTWEFTSSDEHNMKLVVMEDKPVTFIWNMVEISQKSFQSTTALSSPVILQSTRYIPAN